MALTTLFSHQVVINQRYIIRGIEASRANDLQMKTGPYAAQITGYDYVGRITFLEGHTCI